MIIGGDPETLMGEEVFEDTEITEILKRLDQAKENLRQKRVRAREEERIFEEAVRQHREESLRPPTQDEHGVPRDPRDRGAQLGYGANRLAQHGRMRQAQREEQAAEAEVEGILEEVQSRAQNLSD
jgi:hypothetical protein